MTVNAQPGSKEIPEGGGNLAVKVGACKRLSSWSRQERSWSPTPCLKQCLLLSKTWGLRGPIPLMPQINNKRFLAAEKLLKQVQDRQLQAILCSFNISISCAKATDTLEMLHWISLMLCFRWPFPHTLNCPPLIWEALKKVTAVWRELWPEPLVNGTC